MHITERFGPYIVEVTVDLYIAPSRTNGSKKGGRNQGNIFV